jgi:hypothetical protein
MPEEEVRRRRREPEQSDRDPRDGRIRQRLARLTVRHKTLERQPCKRRIRRALERLVDGG